jgi:glucosaminylphosphatidylinositol acyltransferase
MINQEYRRLKEESIINLKGSTITESYILSLTMPFSILLHYMIFSQPKYESTTMNILLNIFCWLFPYVITFTFFTETYHIFFSIVFFFTLVYVLTHLQRFKFLTQERVLDLNQKRKSFISTYRVSKMLGVCITILVVDFPKSFDRRLSKCEGYGISMMDLGVGTFIFSSAMISTITSRSILKILKSVGPMMILGLLRWASVTVTNYPVHLTEYGTHWNFFFTLASISIFINLIGHSKFDLILGILSGILHEILLRNGLETYIMDPNRVSFVDFNKEGIFTLLSYVSIYYIASSFGQLFQKERTREEWKNLLIYCWMLTILFFIPLGIWTNQFPISRRLGISRFYF